MKFDLCKYYANENCGSSLSDRWQGMCCAKPVETPYHLPRTMARFEAANLRSSVHDSATFTSLEPHNKSRQCKTLLREASSPHCYHTVAVMFICVNFVPIISILNTEHVRSRQVHQVLR